MSAETVTLESMCELIVDCPHSTPRWTDSGFIVLRNQNIRNGQLDLSSPSYTNEEGYEARTKRANPQAGDIVFTREAPMGEVCLIPEGLTCCLGQRQVLLRPKSTVTGEYLYWALQSPFVQYQISWNEGTGTTVSNVRIPVLKALQIPRQGNDEPIIADTLSSLVNKIHLNHQINQTLEQMAQTIFKNWFVDFEPVKAKMAALQAGGSEQDALLAAMQAISGKDEDQLSRLQTAQPEQYAELKATAELFPSAMQDSELGEIPEGWEAGKLNDLAALPNNRISTKALSQDSYISTENMLENRGGVCRASSLPSSATVLSFEPLQILVSNIRPYFKKIWFANYSGGRSPDVLGFECKYQGVSEYLYNLLYQDRFFDYMMLTSKGAKMPRGDKQAIMQFSFALSPIELMQRFSMWVSSFYKLIDSNDLESKFLASTRDTLLPKLLSGELAISNVTEAEEAEA